MTCLACIRVRPFINSDIPTIARTIGHKGCSPSVTFPYCFCMTFLTLNHSALDTAFGTLQDFDCVHPPKTQPENTNSKRTTNEQREHSTLASANGGKFAVSKCVMRYKHTPYDWCSDCRAAHRVHVFLFASAKIEQTAINPPACEMIFFENETSLPNERGAEKSHPVSRAPRDAGARVDRSRRSQTAAVIHALPPAPSSFSIPL